MAGAPRLQGIVRKRKTQRLRKPCRQEQTYLEFYATKQARPKK